MTAPLVQVLSLKRKRDWSDTRDGDDAHVGACHDDVSDPASKKIKCVAGQIPIAGKYSSQLNHRSTLQSKLPTSSCRFENQKRRSPLSTSLSERDQTEGVTSTTTTEAGPSSINDLQDSLVACTIESETQDPPRTTEPFGFDTTLSNVQFGFIKSQPYRFTSPLSPQPEKRKRVKSRRHRAKSTSLPLLKATLHRNHVLSIRRRWPDLFRPRSPTHLDSVPQLDDDEFDDDEDDEVIDDIEDDTQVSDIVELYGRNREGTPEPETRTVETECVPEAISIPDTLSCLPPVIAKPLPLRTSNLANIIKELAPKSSLPICVNA